MSDVAIVWTPTATRALTALPEEVATAATEFVYVALAAAPDRAVTIVAIQHRADVYRRR